MSQWPCLHVFLCTFIGIPLGKFFKPVVMTYYWSWNQFSGLQPTFQKIHCIYICTCICECIMYAHTNTYIYHRHTCIIHTHVCLCIYSSFMKPLFCLYSYIFVYWVSKCICYFRSWTNKNDSHCYRYGIDG